MFTNFSTDVVNEINNQLNKKNAEDYNRDYILEKYSLSRENLSSVDLVKQLITRYPDKDDSGIKNLLEERYRITCSKGLINKVRTRMKDI